MLNTRMDDLLVSTTRELQEGRFPLNGQWLVDNQVKADECFALADILVSCIHTYRATMKLAIDLVGADDKNLPQLVAAMSIRSGGPFAVIAEAASLEEQADEGRST